MRKATRIFEEELSGEPLYQDAVEEAIQIAQYEVIKRATKVAASRYSKWYKKKFGTVPSDEFDKIKSNIELQLKLELE